VISVISRRAALLGDTVILYVATADQVAVEWDYSGIPKAFIDQDNTSNKMTGQKISPDSTLGGSLLCGEDDLQ
jgi:hypothetical protein